MRKKYKIYSVILTGIILTGCKSVRMTSQDRQQFMPNGISVAQQLLEETEDATQAKSPEAIKTTLSANNTTSESSVEESESSMKESNQSQDEQENNVNILALEIEPYELSDVCSAIFEKSLDEVEQSQNQYGMYYLTDGDKRVRKYDMLGLEYEVKGVSGSYSAIAEMATNTLRWQEILLRESFPQDKIDSEMKPEDVEKNCREIAEKIGYSYTYVRTYAMDLQSIKKINKNAEDSVSGPGYENKEDEYDGTWSGVFTGGKPWTQEDEAYLVIMKNPLINGRTLENNGNFDIAWMVYHPVKGLLYMKIPPRYRICSEQKKNLIDRTQAADYLDKEINATNIDGKSIQITDISLVYAVDELSSEGIQCSPYWRFGFQKRKNSESVWLYKDLNEYDTYSDTEDGKHQENGYFLINAVDGSIMY